MTAPTDRMTAEDLARARSLLGLSPGELAAEIGLTEHVVRAWEEGSLRIPRQYALQIAFRAAIAERQAALATSGLPECGWVARWMHGAPQGPGERQHFEALRRHAATCPDCTARARFIEHNFPPMPDLPVPAVVKAARTAANWLEKRPPWLGAAAVGAVALGVFTVLRVGGMAVNGEAPSAGGALLLIIREIVRGAVLGAAAGLTYTISRDPLRRLGAAGDYLAGMMCVWAVMLVHFISMQLLTGHPAFATPNDAGVVALAGAVVGAIIGQLWFRRR
ncbi:MAG: helix-turn-helix domain-containing protein [Gemmatimonadaceae bacterium]